ncbi:MAG: hypothetical protein RIQ56_475 [Candidatus Parcubacteria bacterium]|jgi:thiol-disulfide isomerase/thioredoxin
MNRTVVIAGGIVLALVGFAYIQTKQSSDSLAGAPQEKSADGSQVLPVAEKMMKEESGAEEGAMSGDSMMASDSEMKKTADVMIKEDAMMPAADSLPGSYKAYSPELVAMADKGYSVVLFFHAPWCPTCKKIESEIQAKTIPNGIQILKVDYDTASELKKKYGVTYQHTFVHVSGNGELLHKWGDVFTLQDLAMRLK